jgi:low affinity Fe/Cu permease
MVGRGRPAYTQKQQARTHACQPDAKERQMLSTIALILIVLWLLGMVSSYTMGGFIHILLVVAVVVFLVRVIQGRRPVV